MNLVFVDKQNCEWKIGKSPIDYVEPEKIKLFILPFMVDAMYPEDCSEYIYSHCAKCGKSLESGLITLGFQNESAFGVRISCESHLEGETFRIPLLITNVFEILKPIIDKGCIKEYDKCRVCEGSVKCRDPGCILFMKKYQEYTLFDHFYDIHLNVFAPFGNGICHYCSRENVKKFCQTCKLYMFCNKKCREKSGHVCKSAFYEIWRS